MINSKINLCDNIYINVSDVNKVRFSIEDLNDTNNNIVLNILEYIQNTYNIKERLDIYIEKNIPIGAGLGGGSADGACVLQYLNNKYNLKLDIKQLEKIGLMFGADIPYCLHNETSYVYGIGDNIINIEIKPFKALLICPNIYVNTKLMFLNNKIYGNKFTLNEAKKFATSDFSNLFKNDFLMQLLENDKFRYIYNTLNKYGIVGLSGSGPSMIFIPKNKDINYFKKILKDCKIYEIYIKE